MAPHGLVGWAARDRRPSEIRDGSTPSGPARRALDPAPPRRARMRARPRFQCASGLVVPLLRFQRKQVVDEERWPDDGFHDGQEHQPKGSGVSVDVIDERSDEAQEPDTPNSACCALLPLVGHKCNDASDGAREPGPLVTGAAQRRMLETTFLRRCPLYSGSEPHPEQLEVIWCRSGEGQWSGLLTRATIETGTLRMRLPDDGRKGCLTSHHAERLTHQ